MNKPDGEQPLSGDTAATSESVTPVTQVPPSEPPPSVTSTPATSSRSQVGQFVSGVDERCLWLDPLAADRRTASGAVLLGDLIRAYTKEFNILFDKDTFEDGKLKGGSY